MLAETIRQIVIRVTSDDRQSNFLNRNEMTTFSYIRDRWHPLHRARKNRLFRAMLTLLDVDIQAKSCFRRPIFMKLVTHSPYFLAPYALEAPIRLSFLRMVTALPSGARFFDIGANIGMFTWLAAGNRADLAIYAVEPDPSNFRLLTKTKEKWGSTHVEILPFAISARKGRADFKRDTVTSATGSLEAAPTFNERYLGGDSSVIEVETITLDSMTEVYGAPALIKIDVEGHEAEVFAGGWSTLERHRPALLFESFNLSEEVAQRLREMGYGLLDAERAGAISPKTTNYLALVEDSPLARAVAQSVELLDVVASKGNAP